MLAVNDSLFCTMKEKVRVEALSGERRESGGEADKEWWEEGQGRGAA